MTRYPTLAELMPDCTLCWDRGEIEPMPFKAPGATEPCPDCAKDPTPENTTKEQEA